MSKKSVSIVNPKAKKTKKILKRKIVSKKKKLVAEPKKQSINQQLVENLISLQKVNLHTAERFEVLSKQISELVLLFEKAANEISKAPGIENKELSEKLDRLIEQNRLVAKGITLLEERTREDEMQTPTKPIQIPTAQPQSPAQPVAKEITPSKVQPQKKQAKNKESEEKPETPGFTPPPGGRALPKF